MIKLFDKLFHTLFAPKSKKLKKSNKTFTGYKHVFDETFPQPASMGMASWNNVHGYAAPDGSAYYACVDMRTMGIRVQDIVVLCENEADMKEWCKTLKYSKYAVDAAKSHRHDRGTECDTCFTFKTTDGKEKYYNITCTSDFYVY